MTDDKKGQTTIEWEKKLLEDDDDFDVEDQYFKTLVRGKFYQKHLASRQTLTSLVCAFLLLLYLWLWLWPLVRQL